MPDIDPHNQGIESGQFTGHVDHAQIPAAVAGDEQHDPIRLHGRGIERDFAKAAERQGGFGNAARPPAGTGQDQQECDTDELAKHALWLAVHSGFRQRPNTPRMPPEIRAATSSRTVGKARPPGTARYFGRQAGENFSL